jgi:hypothetical protein
MHSLGSVVAALSVAVPACTSGPPEPLIPRSTVRTGEPEIQSGLCVSATVCVAAAAILYVV